MATNHGKNAWGLSQVVTFPVPRISYSERVRGGNNHSTVEICNPKRDKIATLDGVLMLVGEAKQFLTKERNNMRPERLAHILSCEECTATTIIDRSQSWQAMRIRGGGGPEDTSEEATLTLKLSAQWKKGGMEWSSGTVQRKTGSVKQGINVNQILIDLVREKTEDLEVDVSSAESTPNKKGTGDLVSLNLSVSVLWSKGQVKLHRKPYLAASFEDAMAICEFLMSTFRDLTHPMTTAEAQQGEQSKAPARSAGTTDEAAIVSLSLAANCRKGGLEWSKQTRRKADSVRSAMNVNHILLNLVRDRTGNMEVDTSSDKGWTKGSGDIVALNLAANVVWSKGQVKLHRKPCLNISFDDVVQVCEVLMDKFESLTNPIDSDDESLTRDDLDAIADGKESSDQLSPLRDLMADLETQLKITDNWTADLENRLKTLQEDLKDKDVTGEDEEAINRQLSNLKENVCNLKSQLSETGQLSANLEDALQAASESGSQNSLTSEKNRDMEADFPAVDHVPDSLSQPMDRQLEALKGKMDDLQIQLNRASEAGENLETRLKNLNETILDQHQQQEIEESKRLLAETPAKPASPLTAPAPAPAPVPEPPQQKGDEYTASPLLVPASAPDPPHQSLDEYTALPVPAPAPAPALPLQKVDEITASPAPAPDHPQQKVDDFTAAFSALSAPTKLKTKEVDDLSIDSSLDYMSSVSGSDSDSSLSAPRSPLKESALPAPEIETKPVTPETFGGSDEQRKGVDVVNGRGQSHVSGSESDSSQPVPLSPLVESTFPVTKMEAKPAMPGTLGGSDQRREAADDDEDKGQPPRFDPGGEEAAFFRKPLSGEHSIASASDLPSLVSSVSTDSFDQLWDEKSVDVGDDQGGGIEGRDTASKSPFDHPPAATVEERAETVPAHGPPKAEPSPDLARPVDIVDTPKPQRLDEDIPPDSSIPQKIITSQDGEDIDAPIVLIPSASPQSETSEEKRKENSDPNLYSVSQREAIQREPKEAAKSVPLTAKGGNATTVQPAVQSQPESRGDQFTQAYSALSEPQKRPLADEDNSVDSSIQSILSAVYESDDEEVGLNKKPDQIDGTQNSKQSERLDGGDPTQESTQMSTKEDSRKNEEQEKNQLESPIEKIDDFTNAFSSLSHPHGVDKARDDTDESIDSSIASIASGSTTRPPHSGENIGKAAHATAPPHKEIAARLGEKELAEKRDIPSAITPSAPTQTRSDPPERTLDPGSKVDDFTKAFAALNTPKLQQKEFDEDESIDTSIDSIPSTAFRESERSLNTPNQASQRTEPVDGIEHAAWVGEGGGTLDNSRGTKGRQGELVDVSSEQIERHIEMPEITNQPIMVAPKPHQSSVEDFTHLVSVLNKPFPSKGKIEEDNASIDSSVGSITSVQTEGDEIQAVSPRFRKPTSATIEGPSIPTKQDEFTQAYSAMNKASPDSKEHHDSFSVDSIVDTIHSVEEPPAGNKNDVVDLEDGTITSSRKIDDFTPALAIHTVDEAAAEDKNIASDREDDMIASRKVDEFTQAFAAMNRGKESEQQKNDDSIDSSVDSVHVNEGTIPVENAVSSEAISAQVVPSLREDPLMLDIHNVERKEPHSAPPLKKKTEEEVTLFFSLSANWKEGVKKWSNESRRKAKSFKEGMMINQALAKLTKERTAKIESDVSLAEPAKINNLVLLDLSVTVAWSKGQVKLLRKPYLDSTFDNAVEICEELLGAFKGLTYPFGDDELQQGRTEEALGPKPVGLTTPEDTTSAVISTEDDSNRHDIETDDASSIGVSLESINSSSLDPDVGGGTNKVLEPASQYYLKGTIPEEPNSADEAKKHDIETDNASSVGISVESIYSSNLEPEIKEVEINQFKDSATAAKVHNEKRPSRLEDFTHAFSGLKSSKLAIQGDEDSVDSSVGSISSASASISEDDQALDGAMPSVKLTGAAREHHDEVYKTTTHDTVDDSVLEKPNQEASRRDRADEYTNTYAALNTSDPKEGEEIDESQGVDSAYVSVESPATKPLPAPCVEDSSGVSIASEEDNNESFAQQRMPSKVDDFTRAFAAMNSTGKAAAQPEDCNGSIDSSVESIASAEYFPEGDDPDPPAVEAASREEEVDTGKSVPHFVEHGSKAAAPGRYQEKIQGSDLTDSFLESSASGGVLADAIRPSTGTEEFKPAMGMEGKTFNTPDATLRDKMDAIERRLGLENDFLAQAELLLDSLLESEDVQEDDSTSMRGANKWLQGMQDGEDISVTISVEVISDAASTSSGSFSGETDTTDDKLLAGSGVPRQDPESNLRNNNDEPEYAAPRGRKQTKPWPPPFETNPSADEDVSSQPSTDEDEASASQGEVSKRWPTVITERTAALALSHITPEERGHEEIQEEKSVEMQGAKKWPTVATGVPQAPAAVSKNHKKKRRRPKEKPPIPEGTTKKLAEKFAPPQEEVDYQEIVEPKERDPYTEDVKELEEIAGSGVVSELASKFNSATPNVSSAGHAQSGEDELGSLDSRAEMRSQAFALDDMSEISLSIFAESTLPSEVQAMVPPLLPRPTHSPQAPSPTAAQEQPTRALEEYSQVLPQAAVSLNDKPTQRAVLGDNIAAQDEVAISAPRTDPNEQRQPSQAVPPPPASADVPKAPAAVEPVPFFEQRSVFPSTPTPQAVIDRLDDESSSVELSLETLSTASSEARELGMEAAYGNNEGLVKQEHVTKAEQEGKPEFQSLVHELPEAGIEDMTSMTLQRINAPHDEKPVTPISGGEVRGVEKVGHEGDILAANSDVSVVSVKSSFASGDASASVVSKSILSVDASEACSDVAAPKTDSSSSSEEESSDALESSSDTESEEVPSKDRAVPVSEQAEEAEASSSEDGSTTSKGSQFGQQATDKENILPDHLQGGAARDNRPQALSMVDPKAPLFDYNPNKVSVVSAPDEMKALVMQPAEGALSGEKSEAEITSDAERESSKPAGKSGSPRSATGRGEPEAPRNFLFEFTKELDPAGFKPDNEEYNEMAEARSSDFSIVSVNSELTASTGDFDPEVELDPARLWAEEGQVEQGRTATTEEGRAPKPTKKASRAYPTTELSPVKPMAEAPVDSNVREVSDEPGKRIKEALDQSVKVDSAIKDKRLHGSRSESAADTGKGVVLATLRSFEEEKTGEPFLLGYQRKDRESTTTRGFPFDEVSDLAERLDPHGVEFMLSGPQRGLASRPANISVPHPGLQYSNVDDAFGRLSRLKDRLRSLRVLMDNTNEGHHLVQKVQEYDYYMPDDVALLGATAKNASELQQASTAPNNEDASPIDEAYGALLRAQSKLRSLKALARARQKVT